MSRACLRGERGQNEAFRCVLIGQSGCDENDDLAFAAGSRAGAEVESHRVS